MKKLLVFGLCVLFAGVCFARDLNVMIDDALGKLPGAASKILSDVKVITVMPFEYEKDITNKSIEDKVARAMAKTGKFKVMDKASLKSILEEQKMSLTGMTEDTDVKKIGKLLNSDALLFGKVNISDEKLIISLTLKDVATGALVWTEEFVGEDLNRIYFGPGLRTGYFNAAITNTLMKTANGAEAVVPQETIENGFFWAFSFSYIQRMQEIKGISFSIDGVFYRGFAQCNPFTKSVTVDSTSYQLSTNANFTDLKLNLCALIRIHPGYLFGWNNDFLVFYGGPGLDGNYMLASGTYTLDSESVSYEKKFGEALAFGGITLRAGIEMRFTNNFSLMIETYYIPDVTYNFRDVPAFSNGITVTPSITFKSGQGYGLGVRYVIF